MAQIVRLARGALHGGAMLLERSGCRAARFPERFDGSDVLLVAAERIEQAAVRGGIDQRALVMLAVDLDQRGAHGLQRLHGDRLVVDEGAGAAVGKLHTAQNHLAGIIEAVVGEDSCRRVVLRHVESGRHLPLLGTVAHQRGIATAAERQRKRIEQDGFARAGFAGQHGQSAGEFDIESFDQDDVADRQTRQHEEVT
jgi:hypothetical protein